jgi:DNA ligase (NAD+)
MSFDLIEQAEAARVQELEALVAQARHDYYNQQPSVTDEAYDAWVDELAELKEDSPAVTAVGAPPVSAWPKVEHSIPMGSLDKVQTVDAMTSWVQKYSRSRSQLGTGYEHLIVTEKLDGISLSLKYTKGKFVQGLTRGDGNVGEDITPNVARMKGVLHELPKPIDAMIRGEIVLLKEDHKKHFPHMANPRNAASGTSKRLDGQGSEHLTVVTYHAEAEGQDIRSETEMFGFLGDMGFKTPNWYRSALAIGVRTPQDIWVSYQQSVRESLPYEIDGLVVRFDDLAYQWSLGEKNGRPVGAVAFKFSAITRETKALRRVDQVGGTGKITPVAEFTPVRILGAQIARASLYNQKYIEQIGFYLGGRMLVSRANDVIPRVVSMVHRHPEGEVSQPPEVCPECGTKTERDGEYVICPNVSECPAQTEGRIKQWVRELGVLEWGPTLIQKVVEAGLVKTVPDLYSLKVESLAELDRMGTTSAKNAVGQLWSVVPLPLEQFLGALGIPLCATTTIQTVVDAGFDTLDKVREASKEQLMTIPGMGPRRAESLHGWLQRNSGLVGDLLGAGVTIKERPVGHLTGKSVCFTGKSSLKRAELIRLAETAGGTVKKSVGSGLTYLVLADPSSGSTKTKAAHKNGVECISEEDFLQLVGYGS